MAFFLEVQSRAGPERRKEFVFFYHANLLFQCSTYVSECLIVLKVEGN